MGKKLKKMITGLTSMFEKRSSSTKYDLDELLSRVTPENIHPEIETCPIIYKDSTKDKRGRDGK